MAEADFRTCSICIEQFKIPKLLPCFHTFCCNCLQQYVLNSGDNGTFSCPVCRFEVTVPEGGIEEFQTNFYIEAEAERKDFNPTTSCGVCSNPATRKCLECEQFLCKSCAAVHNSLVGTRTHTTLKLGEVSEETEIISKPKFCIKHKDEIIRFYCRPCEKPICRDCKLTSHEGHKTEDLCDLVNDAKSSLTKTKADFEICVQNTNARLDLIKARRMNVERSRTEIHREINKKTDSLITLINECRQNEIERINDVAQTEVKSLKDKESENLLKKRSLLAQIDHVTTMLSTGLDADVMTTAVEVKKVLRDVQHTHEMDSPFYTETSEQFILEGQKSRQWLNTIASMTAIMIRSEATNLRIKWIIHFTNQLVDVIGPVSDINGSWISCISAGSQYYFLYLVSVEGKITKKIIVNKDRYNHIRRMGMKGLAVIPSGEPSNCEKCEVNNDSKEKKQVSSEDGAPKIYTFTGKNTPLYDTKPNGVRCRVDFKNNSVEITLSDGKKISCNKDDGLKYQTEFCPRDVCWGLKDDIFIADCGSNVVHQYHVTEGFKNSFVMKDKSFSPTAVAVDHVGKLWIGESNGRISICDIY